MRNLTDRIRFQANGSVLPEHDIMTYTADVLDEIEAAYTSYEQALANREHGGVAMNRLANRIGEIISRTHKDLAK